MNKEIMALEGRELDAAVAEVAEYLWLVADEMERDADWVLVPQGDTGAILGFSLAYRKPDTTGWTDADWCAVTTHTPRYHSSLDAIRPLVERCVEEIGRPTYRVCLRQACDHTETWIHFASATDHCRAILLCLGDREVARGEAEV
jgi:hypothetical protein